MVAVAFNFVGNDTDVTIEDGRVYFCKPKKCAKQVLPTFEQVFELPDPSDPKYYSFANWDDFFLRNFSHLGNTVGLGPRPRSTASLGTSRGQTVAPTTIL